MVKRYLVDSSDGQTKYLVTRVAGQAVACTCRGFLFRHNCKHMALVQTHAHELTVVEPAKGKK
jgi:hypothetical protein